jgi:hypothetical protein
MPTAEPQVENRTDSNGIYVFELGVRFFDFGNEIAAEFFHGLK